VQLREALRLRPDHPNARQKLERALAAQQEVEHAAEPYRAALRANPGDARAHGNLGRVLLEAGEVKEAIEQCAEAARLAPDSAEAQYQLGAVLARKGEVEKAVRQFELALELDPKLAAAHYALGIICQQQRRMLKALAHWREAARLAPQWPDPLNNLAWTLATGSLAELRDGAKAVELARRAVELAGTDNVGMLDTLAAAYAEAGRFTEAASTARQAATAAVAQGQTGLAEQIQQRLALYESNRPYRQQLGPP
jgi:Flp pilus assembly protein TadD